MNSVAPSPDGQLAASASDDGSARLWRIADGTLVRTLAGHTALVLSSAFSPDGTLLATGSADHAARLWQVSNGGLVQKLTRPAGAALSVAFSPDGHDLVAGSDDGNTLRVDASGRDPPLHA